MVGVQIQEERVFIKKKQKKRYFLHCNSPTTFKLEKIILTKKDIRDQLTREFDREGIIQTKCGLFAGVIIEKIPVYKKANMILPLPKRQIEEYFKDAKEYLEQQLDYNGYIKLLTIITSKPPK